ncbi:DUF3455 domain-containing protein [Achromobacter denitrificans]
MKNNPFRAREIVFGIMLAATGVAAGNPAAAAQDDVPLIMQVPAGNTLAWRASARGSVTYECQAIQTDGSRYAWIIRHAAATLGSDGNARAGSYESPPETWRAADGSVLTGMEAVRAYSGPDRLYDQLVLANPARGSGLLTGVTYIQRLVAAGGAAPRTPCSAAAAGQREQIPYEADYLFWKPD